MKQLLSIFIALAFAFSGRSARAEALPEAAMALSDQIVGLEKKKLGTPDFRVLRPLTGTIIRLERDGGAAYDATFQHIAHLLEDYRDMARRAFGHDHYDVSEVERALVRLRVALPNPRPSVLAIVTELDGMHEDILALIRAHEEQGQKLFRKYLERSFWKEGSTSSHLPAFFFLIAHRLVRDRPQNNAVAVWSEPLLAATPALLCPKALNVVGPIIESNFDVWTRNLGRLTLQNLVGKAVELVLFQHFGLRKENAKALSKLAKGLQAGKGVPSLISAAIANRGASSISTLLQKSDPTLALVVVPFAAVKFIEEYSRPDMLKSSLSVDSEIFSALDYWILRPYLFKTLSTGTRYAVEKVLHQKYLTTLANMMKRVLPQNLAEGYLISFSKMGTSAATQGVISAYEITLDAWSEEPMYTNKYARMQKFATDVVLGIVTSAVIGAVVPTSLYIAAPYVIVGLWIAYYTPSMVSYGSSLVW